VVSFDLADQIVATFLATPFEGGRHERRVAQLAEIEQQEGTR
jgi:ribose 5-phosphate isomerase B